MTAEAMGYTILGIIGFPILLYVSAKLVTLGYLRAKQRFDEENHNEEEKKNGNVQA